MDTFSKTYFLGVEKTSVEATTVSLGPKNFTTYGNLVGCCGGHEVFVDRCRSESVTLYINVSE